MKLLSVLKTSGGILAMMLVLTSCSNTLFPDVDENADNDKLVVDGPGKKFIPESRSLTSDLANAMYSDNVSITSKSYPSNAPVAEEKTSSDQILPVIKGQPTDSTLDKMLSGVDSNSTEASDNALPTPDSFSIRYLAATFLFEDGSATLNSQYNAKIREIVKTAKQNKAVVNVYGYASSRTRNTDEASHKMANFAISSKRADAVAQALKRAGLPAKQIKVEALSDSNPAYLEVMPEGERLNRRAEVFISY